MKATVIQQFGMSGLRIELNLTELHQMKQLHDRLIQKCKDEPQVTSEEEEAELILAVLLKEYTSPENDSAFDAEKARREAEMRER